MPNLNRVFLLGRVVKDPELRYTPKQTAVAELGLAINRVTTDPEGQKHEEVTFVDITLWPGKPRSLSNISRKEVPSSSKGVSNWTLGTTGSPVRNVGEHLRLLGSRKDSEAAASGPTPPPRPTASPLQRRAGTGGPAPDPGDIPYSCDRG